ncbi:MAG: hypothetical protein K2F67_03885 [Eubacterium sp.]|nr:hypothetical protein [Eubacterium sp.]
MKSMKDRKEKVRTITVSYNPLNNSNFDEEVEKFIRTVDVLAIEYSCSVSHIQGLLITTQSTMIIYNDKEADNDKL